MVILILKYVLGGTNDLKKILSILIILLFILSSLQVIGIDNKTSSTSDNNDLELIDPPWSMYGHDQYNTGRSPYSTADNPMVEKWRFKMEGVWATQPIIDKNGTIYVNDGFRNLYAINPDGSLKWKIDMNGDDYTPIVDNNDILYFLKDGYVHALGINGILKWKVLLDEVFDPMSSPVMDKNGVLYIAGDIIWFYGTVFAVNPNGTIRWQYDIGSYINGEPVVDDDGVLYIGANDNRLYAIYTSNGTLKWRITLSGWVLPASIAEDGTIYVSTTNVSWFYDHDFLYAINPNDGSIKWSIDMHSGSMGSPSIGSDGTIYAGDYNLWAINPIDGSIKWIYYLDTDDKKLRSSPTISANGIIYFTVNKDPPFDRYTTELIAVDSNGNELFQKKLTDGWLISSPVISSDGTIYVFSYSDEEVSRRGYNSHGYLHAFGSGEVKNISITHPNKGVVYLFGNEWLNTGLNSAICVGPINVDTICSLPDDKVESVKFRLKDLNEQVTGHANHDWIEYIDTEPPFEWTINPRTQRLRYLRYNLEVRCLFKDGCEWVEDMDIIFIHI
jgi:outer membrane protein assembly factor BamB